MVHLATDRTRFCPWPGRNDPSARHPAPAPTWKRRLAAIDHHHRQADLPPPSREPTVRSWLDTALGRPPSNDQPADASRFEYVLSRIPTHGWPAGLAGRRDRLLVLLTYAGLTRRQLQRLRTTDLTVHRPGDTGPSILHIETGPTAIQLAGSTDSAVCAPCIWLAWQRVLDLRQRYTGNRVLRDAFARTQPLAGNHFCIDTSEPDAASDSWVFLAADQHGYLDNQRPLSIRSLSHRRTDAAAGRITYRTMTLPAESLTHQTDTPTEPEPEPEPSLSPPNRDQVQTQYRAALARRARDRAQLEDLEAVFDDLERRIATWDASFDDLQRPKAAPQAPLTAED